MNIIKNKCVLPCFFAVALVHLCMGIQNLVSNGDFEQESGIGALDFKKGHFGPKISGVEWKYSQELDSKNHIISIKSEYDEANSYWEVSKPIELPEKTKNLTVSVKMKFEGQLRKGDNGGYGRIFFFWLDDASVTILQEEVVLTNTNSDWKTYEQKIPIPENGRKLKVLCQLIGKGTVSFDDLKIYTSGQN